MTRNTLFLLAGLLAGITALAPTGSSAETPLPDTKQARPLVVPGEILVKYSDKASHAVRQDVAAKLGGRQEELDLYGNLRRVRLPEGKTIPEALGELQDEWAVEYAEPVYYRYRLACGDSGGQSCPDDELFDQQWAMHDDQDTDMDMPEAWNTETGESGDTGTSDIIIAIIDDGFDTDHPDLATPFGNRGTSCTDSSCSGSPDFQDQDESHGTAVAGAAGAEGNNAEGITGSARVAKLYPIRLADLTSAAITKGILHAVGQNAHIINLSLGGPTLSQAEEDAIIQAKDAGVLIVAAAGNQDASADQGTAYYPANVEQPNVLAVGATDEFQQVAGFSVWGPLKVDVAAPGHKVLTTQVDGAYREISGTSFASPFTAGVAALVGQDLLDDNGADPANLGYEDLKTRIMAGAENTNDNIADEIDSKLTGRFLTGRVNAHQALESTNPLASRGPVMVLDDISVSDPTASGGDGDGQIDPGETASLVVSIRNINHEDTSGITNFDGRLGVAKSPSAASLLSGDQPTATFTDTGDGTTYTASFPLTFSDFDGHQRFLLKLDIDHGADSSFEETRWAWQEAGRLLADDRHRQAIGRVDFGSSTTRTAWDDFHHFHYTATQDHQSLVFQTSTDHDAGMDSDIDLIVREGATPEYNIALNPPEGEESFFVGPRNTDGSLDSSVRLSGRFDGEESVTFDNVTAGTTYEIVVVNFSQESINYDIEAVTDPSTVRFTSDTFSVAEGDSATITVERLNPTPGGLTVGYQARVEDRLSNSANSDEFEQVSGELTWNADEGGTKSFSVDTFDNLQADGDKRFQVALSMPSGTRAALGDTTTALVTIEDSGNTSEPDSGGSGGGGGGPLAPALLAMLALLGLRRRN